MKTKEGRFVENPRYKKDTKTWHCPECGKQIDIYNEDESYWYVTCECGCPSANWNLLEDRAS